MLLDWINSLELLEHDPGTTALARFIIESNVLMCFPPPIRRVIITEATNFLYQSSAVAGMTTGSSSATSTPTAMSTSLTAGNFGGAAYTVSALTPTGSGTDGFQSLSTLFHVRWVMEIIGQAFTLPLEDITVINNATAIYIQWLVEPTKRPLVIQKADYETQQWFLQTLFRHMSLLFNAKKVDGAGAAKPLLATLASKHVKLCKLVLRTLSQVANVSPYDAMDNDHDPIMSSTTWKILLRVLLGATDFLLQKPANPYCYLSEELGEHLLSTLMELWLRSQIFSTELWNSLKLFYPRWTHRMLAITQWSAVSLALTQRVTKILYGQGTFAVVYTVHSNLVTLELSDQFAVYAWHQVIHLAGSPNDKNPQIFFRSVLGMEKLVQVFHSIGNVDNSGALERLFPDGNTILHIVGSWLFDAVSRDSPGCAEGRAQAFGVLCRIVSHPQNRHPFLATYLHQFYAAIIDGLKGDLLSLVFIIVNCEDIFALGLPGVRILVAPFVMALRRIIPNLEKPLRVSLNLDDLRRACYKLLCTIFGFCDHFSAVMLSSPKHTTEMVSEGLTQPIGESSSLEKGKAPTVKFIEELKSIYKPILGSLELESGSMSHTRYWILEALIASFLDEKDPGNIRYLINTLTVFAMDEAYQTPGIISLMVQLFENELCAGKWPVDVCLVTIESLRQFVSFESAISKTDHKIVRQLVISLCECAQSLITRNNLSLFLRPISCLFDCILDWVIGTSACATWFVSDFECQSFVIKLLTRALNTGRESAKRLDIQDTAHPSGGKSNAESRGASPNYSLASPPSAAIKSLEGQLANSAEIALAKLLQYFGNGASNPFFPVHTSSLLNECLLVGTKVEGGLDFISGLPKKISSLTKEELRRMRYFILNSNTIACFVERPAEGSLKNNHNSQETTEVVALLRSFVGKSAWENSIIYTLNPEKYQSFLSIATAQDNDDPVEEERGPARPIYNDPMEGPSLATHPVNDGRIKVRNSSYQSTNENIFSTHNQLADSLCEQLELVKTNPELESVPLQLDQVGPAFNSGPSQSRFSRDDKRMLNYTCIEGLSKDQIKKIHSVTIQSGDALRNYQAKPSTVSSPDTQYSRLLLSQFGMTSLKSRDSTVQLPTSVELLSDLEILDSLPEREALSCSVFYIRSGRQSLHDIMSETSVSQDFAAFTRTLGWPVDPRRHPGWAGLLSSDVTTSIPYYTNNDFEVVFNVPNLMDHEALCQAINNDQQLTIPAEGPPHLSGLYKIMANDLVSILWIEDLQEMLTLPSKFQTRSIVYICISPLSDPESIGLYRIRIMVTSSASMAISNMNPQGVAGNQNANEAVFLFGPLLDGMIVRRESLGQLVRDTAISACLFCLYGIQNQPKPYIYLISPFSLLEWQNARSLLIM